MSETRVHPLFSTLQETSPQSLYSDHLPIVVSVPIDGDKTHDLKLLSYNVMEAGIKNNLTRAVETHDLANERYQRIMNGLKICADQLNLDVIVLQEVSSTIILGYLQTLLDSGWDCLPSVEAINRSIVELIKSARPQQLTLYRKSTLDLTVAKDWDSRRKTLSTSFLAKKANKIVHLHNVWGEYDIFPDKLEIYFRDLLTQRKDDECVIVLGDTNSRLAPVFSDDFENLTTGIIPSMFNPNYHVADTIQVPDHPDGGFYSDKDGAIHQLDVKTIDIETGKVVVDQRSLSEITAKMTEEEKAVWHTPRGILCIDDFYKDKVKGKKIDGKTIFTYEEELRTNFGDDKILVRMTSSICNEKGILVRLKAGKQSDSADLIVSLMPEGSVQFSLLESGARRFPTLFISAGRLDDFANTIKMICAVKSAIKNLDQQSLDKMILEANDAYTKNSSKLLAIVSFGLYGESKRDANIKSRVDAARVFEQSPHDLVIALLGDDKTGESMKSFKYFLVSKLTGIKVANDIQAKQLIDLVMLELKKHPQQEKVVEVKSPEGPK